MSTFHRKVVGVALSIAGLAFIACGSDTAPSNDGQVSPPNSSTLETNRETQGEVQGLDADETTATRRVRRLRIDHLEAAISRAAGNDLNGDPIVWRWYADRPYLHDKSTNGLADTEGAFGQLLGRPDYLTRTEEERSASLLYLKLIRDMARNVCQQMVDADTSRPDSEEYNLWRYAPVDSSATDEQITKNIQYLILRFLSLRVGANDDMLTDYRAVYDAGALESATKGWRAVCIGLLESPLFHLE